MPCPGVCCRPFPRCWPCSCSAVGALAIALGSPLGFANSATAGIVSGLGRVIPAEGAQGQPLVDPIQTDAAISPGNSGGALVNGDGAVIGVNEAYIQLLRGGRVQHGYLGIEPTTLTPDMAQQLGVEHTGGVVIQALAPRGPAAAGGLRPDDIIVSLGGTATPTTSELYEGSPSAPQARGRGRRAHHPRRHRADRHRHARRQALLSESPRWDDVRPYTAA